MTHPERKAVSDERERLLRASENWRDFMRNVHDGSNEWRYSDERRLLADLLSIETMLRADAEKDETIRRLREEIVTARVTGITNAADWVRDRRFEHEKEHGYIEPDTGALSYGRGAHANAKEEYNCDLCEIEERLRTLAATASPAPDTKDGVKS